MTVLSSTKPKKPIRIAVVEDDLASPRQLSRMLEPTFTAKNEINSDVFIFPAKKGRMLMWPSYLPHAVEHGTANEDEDRIVVAFNVMIRGLVEQLTMRMDFK